MSENIPIPILSYEQAVRWTDLAEYRATLPYAEVPLALLTPHQAAIRCAVAARHYALALQDRPELACYWWRISETELARANVLARGGV